MITEAEGTKLHGRVKRIFNQSGAREHLLPPTLHRRYHPALGYL
jgi:hypothetical protein